ncbi:hypothetical protein JUM41_19985 [Rhizobium pusense]|uniref:hypothetical protein n=1 Tax=Agrobacterium pusense TaxID=648995 RepID=UPI001FCD8A86|nr:hypothetical protein [Agrobacterium pusense]MCJ2876533.1 hypothetical protein [Agrobacterium pusense]
MYSHPLSLLGYCVFVGGWIWLLGGSSSDVGLSRNIINIHGAMMSLATILSGIGLVLAGMISSREQQSATPAANQRVGTRKSNDRAETAVAHSKEIDEAEIMRRKMMERGINV